MKFAKYLWSLLAVGMVALLVISLSLAVAQPATGARQRNYYIAADEVIWDYAPSYPTGISPMTGEPYAEDMAVFLESGPDRIGRQYMKALFQEYTDDSFTTMKPRPPEWEHLGLLGPVIRAEVGDTIVVHFKNNTSFPASMHPHGVFYEKDSEGNEYNDGTSADDKGDGAVPPGDTWTYTWEVPPRAGPGPDDPSSILWAYHSHVDEAGDTNAGLVGPIIITARGKAKSDGSPRNVDRELITLFTVFDENRSNYLDANIEEFTTASVDPDDGDFQESNLMHGINGFLDGELLGLDAEEGQKVRWYLMAIGTEVDMHTVHWHGNVVLDAGMRADVIMLGPLITKTVDMVPDAPGVWMYHCHVNDHIDAGMMAMYTIYPK